MKIKIIVLFTIIVLLFSFCGCSQSSSQGTVDAFFSELKKYDTEKLSALLTEFPNTDDCGVTYDLFSDEDYINLYQQAYEKDLKFKVTSIRETDSNATAVIEVTHPDLNSAYNQALYAAAAAAMSDASLMDQAMDFSNDISYLVPRQMKAMHENEQIETITVSYTISLIKKDDHWYITTDEQVKNLMSSGIYKITSTIANGLSE